MFIQAGSDLALHALAGGAAASAAPVRRRWARGGFLLVMREGMCKARARSDAARAAPRASAELPRPCAEERLSPSRCHQVARAVTHALQRSNQAGEP